MDIFWSIAQPFLLSVLITAAFVPLTIKLALKYGLVDDPKKRPHPAHVHQTIKPRAGGLPIYLGIVLTALIFLPTTKALIGLVVGSTILLVMGLVDDKLQSFNPYLRLFLLFLAAATVVGSGVGISFISNPLYGLLHLPYPFQEPFIRFDQIVIPFALFGKHSIVLFADILAFLWIITLTQVINWSKGVDGQMESITLVASVILGVLSLRLYFQGDPNQLPIALLCFIVAGSSLGFMLFNWYPSKILPGFSASTILAFFLAVLSILSGAKLATACLTMAIPILDFIYTIIRRISQGKSPVWGDRGHLHHKLLDLGWGPRRISLFYMLGSAILGSVALFVDTESKFFALLGVGLVFLLFILWLNSFSLLSKPSAPGNG